MNLKIVMVEGPHDGAFISKVMQVNGYKTYKRPIKEYQPKFIADYLSNQYKKAPVDEFNVQSVRQQILFPSYSLFLEEKLILIFQMGGDSRADRRNKLVKDIWDFLQNPLTAETISESDKITFVYEFDADDQGISNRLTQINTEIQSVDSTFKGFDANTTYVELNKIRWGAYIFADDSGKGRLEDIVLPMMESDNEDVAKDTIDFVEKRNGFALFKEKKPLTPANVLKVRIGVMGQLDKPGCPNSAIIEQSDYLTEAKIKASDICNQLFNFLNS